MEFEENREKRGGGGNKKNTVGASLMLVC